jgi:hypothetical protein
MRKDKITLLGSALLLFAALPHTYAQQTESQRPGGMMQPGQGLQDEMMGGMMQPGADMQLQMGGMMQRRGMMGMMGCAMMGYGGTAHIAGRIAFLKAELGITDAQKEPWDAYASALRQMLESMQSMHQTMMQVMHLGTPVERLDTRIGAMEGMIGKLKEIRPALANLYAALTEDQKKKADELLTGMACMI